MKMIWPNILPNSGWLITCLLQKIKMEVMDIKDLHLLHFKINKWVTDERIPPKHIFSHVRKVYTSQNIELIIDKWKLKQRDHPKTEEILI